MCRVLPVASWPRGRALGIIHICPEEGETRRKRGCNTSLKRPTTTNREVGLWAVRTERWSGRVKWRPALVFRYSWIGVVERRSLDWDLGPAIRVKSRQQTDLLGVARLVDCSYLAVRRVPTAIETLNSGKPASLLLQRGRDRAGKLRFVHKRKELKGDERGSRLTLCAYVHRKSSWRHSLEG